MLRRLAAGVALAGAVGLAGVVLWLRIAPPDPPPASPAPAPAPAAGPVAPPVAIETTPLAGPAGPPPAVTAAGDCAVGDATAAAANAAGLDAGAWSPSGPVEAGWAAYAPLVAREIGARCDAASPAFAAALGGWRATHGLGEGGAMDAATLKAIVVTWLLRRPFVRATRRGECPPAPDAASLATALPGETQGGKAVQAQPAALEAWRRMRIAARAEVPAVGATPALLAIASGFRGPAEEAARCAQRGCDTVSRSRCSAHRTGTAFDLMLTTDPAVNALSTAGADRKALARTPAYLWLVANADRFGFRPYPYEPWHWEWAGGG